MSIRARLTVSNAALLACTLVVFDLVLYLTLANNLAREFDEALRIRAAEVAAAIAPGTDGDIDPADIRPGALEPASLEDSAEPGVYVQVLSANGRVVATSGTTLPTDKAQVRRALGGVETIGAVGRGDGLRVTSRPVFGSNGVVAGIVQVGQSTQFLDATLADMRTLLIGGTAATLAVAGVAGWLLVGRVLRPVTRITAAADQIVATGRLDARIPPPNSRDEISSLVSSFNRMVEQLERSFAQQRQLVADTSHELRNPLMAIGTNLEVIQLARDPQDRDDAAADARTEVARMTRLIGDLLLLGEGDAGEPLERVPVELVLLVEAAAERARRLGRGHYVRVEQLDPARVLGDADLLQRALWNLVENSLRYTPPSGGYVGLGVRQAGDVAELWVRDNGPGIAPVHHPRLFERFYRVDKARSRRSGGSGLGLAIVGHVAEAHGGQVGVESQPGLGSTFTIRLPIIGCTGPCPDAGKRHRRRHGASVAAVPAPTTLSATSDSD